MKSEHMIGKNQILLGLPREIRKFVDEGGGRKFNVSRITLVASATRQQATSRIVTLNLLIEGAGREPFEKPLTVTLSMRAGDAVSLSEKLKDQAAYAEAIHPTAGDDFLEAKRIGERKDEVI